MKSLPFLALSALALAAPAQAQVTHAASVEHQGRDFAVSYEPQVETKYRQVGIGPRSAASCRWTTTVSVRRTALDAQGQPIAALTRVLERDASRSGSQLGLCSTVSKRQVAAFGGDERKLRAYLADVAASDTGTLRTEFASLSALHSSHAYAR